MNDEIATYNDSLSDDDRGICNKLSEIINRVLKEAESKIWHAHPVPVHREAKGRFKETEVVR